MIECTESELNKLRKLSGLLHLGVTSIQYDDVKFIKNLFEGEEDEKTNP